MKTADDVERGGAPSVADGGAAASVAPAASIAPADAGPADVPLYTSPNRPRGLNAYFAPGGDDDATELRRADERHNLWLLLLMVAALVLIPTFLTIIAFVSELAGHGGG
jgi:hypothetical protein